MNNTQTISPLSWRGKLLHGLLAVVSFHLAYTVSSVNFLIVFYVYGLFRLTNLSSNREAFYSGLLIGLGVFVPQMGFLWTIFGWLAALLWLVLAFWHGIFLLLARECWQRFSRKRAALVIPILWTGLEYFRSELYYLRFAWFTPGFALTDWSGMLKVAGTYGVGFLLMLLVTVLWVFPKRPIKLLGFFVVTLIVLAVLKPNSVLPRPSLLRVAGIQMEFPVALEVPPALDRLVQAHPDAELLVLSEYTFDGPVHERVKLWCKKNKRYLVVGGKDSLAVVGFRNTAFVIGPNGEVVFQQSKSVPIQFFNDGLPATAQTVWDSPWGKLAIPTCYDLSYSKPMDNYIRAGAQAIINPTMDVTEWGTHQHWLHARVPQLRAAEYGIPVFRVASSGISELVDAHGHIKASAPFPGQLEMIAGTLEIRSPGTRPLDRWLAPMCAWMTGLLIIWLSFAAIRKPKNASPQPNA